MNRREFVGKSIASTTAGALLGALAGRAEETPVAPRPGSAPASAASPEPPSLARKVKIGVVGCGGRGDLIAKLFKKHGGYEFQAVADYFQPVAERTGEALGVDKARCFSGLSGYRRVIESDIEAIALETPPYFFPEHAAAAVAAGLHVYMAKPVAVDVPGSLAIETAGQRATQQQRVFFVDYQMPTDPMNIEVATRIRAGALGPLTQVQTSGVCGGFPDPPRTATIESRLERLIWVNDIALGCDYIGNYDIHAIDAALWVIGERPVAAMGLSAIARPGPHGDAHDVCSVLFQYASGVVHNHYGQALKNSGEGGLAATFHGPLANAQLQYRGNAFVRGGTRHFGGGKVENLYQLGITRNIATFYQCVTEGRCDNPTVRRSVDGVLACILGREAASRQGKLTMVELLKENRRLEVDLRGLKA